MPRWFAGLHVVRPWAVIKTPTTSQACLASKHLTWCYQCKRKKQRDAKQHKLSQQEIEVLCIESTAYFLAILRLHCFNIRCQHDPFEMFSETGNLEIACGLLNKCCDCYPVCTVERHMCFLPLNKLDGVCFFQKEKRLWGNSTMEEDPFSCLAEQRLEGNAVWCSAKVCDFSSWSYVLAADIFRNFWLKVCWRCDTLVHLQRNKSSRSFVLQTWILLELDWG